MNILRHAVEADLGEIFGLAWRRRRFLGLMLIAAGLVAFATSFLIEPVFHAQVSILPRKGMLREQQIVLAQESIVNAVELRPTTASNSQNMVMAASYSMREQIVDSLGLVEFFNTMSEAKGDSLRALHLAVDRLRQATHFELSIYRDVLFIHVMTSDPQMSADIANIYIHCLDEENLRLYRQSAQRKVAYLQAQLDELRGRIREHMDETAGFYGNRGLTEIDSERGLLFSLLTELQHQRLAVETALKRERLDAAPGSPEVARLEALRDIYSNVLGAIATGDQPSIKADPVLDVESMLGAEQLEKHLANLEYLESSLATELAAALMETGRSEVKLPVMDRAFAPAEPVWPRRWLLSLSAGLLALVLSYLVLFFREISATMANPQGDQRA